MFAHDLNLFVTVQLLEETLASSLGKLCEDHGYSYEWVSGQKPRLVKDGKSIICKTESFVLAVPLLHRYHRDSLRREAEQAPRELVQPASSSSSSSVSERSDELASRRLVPFHKIPNQDKNEEWTGRILKIRWQIFLTGHRKQTCMHPHTVLRIRSRTSCESGNEIKEAQCLYSLPKRPRL